MKLNPQNPTPLPEPKPALTNRDVLEGMESILRAIERASPIARIPMNEAWAKLHDLKARL